jgi:predicted acyltransferase
MGLGIVLLIFLAVIYKGGSTGDEWMEPQWWGILGLIGWAYLINALYCLMTKGNMMALIIFWLLLNLLSVIAHSNPLEVEPPLSYLATLYTGTIPAFTTAGMIISVFLDKYKEKRPMAFLVPIFLFGSSNIASGLLTRPIWGISKIQATPSWLGICTGIGAILFVMVYYIADIRKHTRWAKPIAPAGTATLSCYMIPYFVYPLVAMSGIALPPPFNSGPIGLLFSFAFAILVVLFTGWLEKKGFKLKL